MTLSCNFVLVEAIDQNCELVSVYPCNKGLRTETVQSNSKLHENLVSGGPVEVTVESPESHQVHEHNPIVSLDIGTAGLQLEFRFSGHKFTRISGSGQSVHFGLRLTRL